MSNYEGHAEMKEEEEFALKWCNTSQIPLATRYTYIAEVYGDKLMEEREKGKMKKAVEELENAHMSIEEENEQFQKDLRKTIRASLEEQLKPPQEEGEGLSHARG